MESATREAPLVNPRDIVRKVVDEMEARLGYADANILVEEARNPQHPLHDRFEWDDTEAATRWRRRQAEQLIRAVRCIVYLKEDNLLAVPIRKYVNLPGDEHKYASRQTAMKVPNVRALFVGRKISDLQNWCNETIDVPELAGLRKVILEQLARMKL